MIPKNRARRRSHGVLIMVNGSASQMPSMNHTTTVQHMIHATWKLADTVSAKCSQYGGADGGEVLPRVIQDAHVVVHGHEIDEQAEAERAEPDAEPAHGLGKPRPRLALERHEPRRADPRGDDREHHAGLRRVFRRVEVGEAELLELRGLK